MDDEMPEAPEEFMLAGITSRSHASMDDWVQLVQLVMAHGQLEVRELLRFSRVSRDWREAVCDVLPTLRALDFCSFNAHITGFVGFEALNELVLAVLARAPEGRALNVRNRKGDTPLLAALRAGQLEAARMLLGWGADASAADDQGETPLLLVCRAGNLQLAKELLGKGADISAGDDQGETPLLAAVAAGNAELAWDLVARGAAVEVRRKDGATVLSLAIFSQNEACIKLAQTQGPKRLQGQGALDAPTFIKQLAQAYLDARTIGAWLRNGAVPSALMGEIGVLMLSADVDAEVKGRLEHVCALLNHYHALLDELFEDDFVGSGVCVCV